MAMSAQQQQIPPEEEYFYVYVAELEDSNVGYWIQLELDKSLSLVNLRRYFPACFGIKYMLVDASNKTEVRYIRYHNGYFRFPSSLDLNNTRFVAYYYDDVTDITAFMRMVESNDPETAWKTVLTAEGENFDESTLLGRTAEVFNMDSILCRGAQSTPVKGSISKQKPSTREKVSSTSDVILNEPTVEIISVYDTHDTMQLSLPPPPAGLPNCAKVEERPSGIKAKLGPKVSSTSDEMRNNAERFRQGITINESSGFQRDPSSVMISVNTVPKSRNMLGRYQQTRPAPQDVNTKTPLKVTFKGRGRQVQRQGKILKIENDKGRTTALLTKKNWKETAANSRGQKRRSESGDEFEEQYDKRRRFGDNYQRPDARAFSAYGNDLPEINVILVGFHDQRPIEHETVKYFSDFGIVTNLQVWPQDNHHGVTEYYAVMRIRTKDALSLFSDRHMYNRTIIYAIRMDGTRPPMKVTCKLCGYYGINVGFLHYHVEGQCHQHHLTKRLESMAAELGPNVYLNSYYRITSNELYVQYPDNEVQEMVRNDYWKQYYQPASYATNARSDYRNYYGRADDGERYH